MVRHLTQYGTTNGGLPRIDIAYGDAAESGGDRGGNRERDVCPHLTPRKAEQFGMYISPMLRTHVFVSPFTTTDKSGGSPVR